MPTTSYGMSYTTCDTNCFPNADSVVLLSNDYSTGSTYTYTTTSNFGSYKINPIRSRRILSVTGPSSQTGFTSTGGWYTQFTQLETRPASGSSYTTIPNLSGMTCPNLPSITVNFSLGATQIYRTNYWYDFEFYDPTNLTTLKNNYRIFARLLSIKGNQESPFTREMVYEVTNGVVTYKNTNFIV